MPSLSPAFTLGSRKCGPWLLYRRRYCPSRRRSQIPAAGKCTRGMKGKMLLIISSLAVFKSILLKDRNKSTLYLMFLYLVFGSWNLVDTQQQLGNLVIWYIEYWHVSCLAGLRPHSHSLFQE